jgi:hypothetical protein
MTDYQRGVFFIGLVMVSVLIFALEAVWLQSIVSHFYSTVVPITLCVVVAAVTDFIAPRMFRYALIISLIVAQLVIWFN